MKKYFYLQFKRLMHIFPFAFSVAVVLLISLALVFSGFMKINAEDANNQTFQIGVAGDTDDYFFQMGKKALETFDSSRFSIGFVELSEEDAAKQLEKGNLSAYVVIPKGFINDALSGEINSIKYVTSAGSIGLVSIFKSEITKVIEEILVCSQKGVFGLEDALVDNEIYDSVYDHINTVNIQYIDHVINRGEMYTTQELGISDGTSLSEYLICGIGILFLFIIGLPYVGAFVKKDMSLHRVISAKGYNYKKQITSELLSYVLVLFVSVVAILLALFVVCVLRPSLIPVDSFGLLSAFKILVLILPIVFLAASFCTMLFEFTVDIVSAVLLQFFVSVSLCYISGCLYPIYTFPITVQKIAPFLPMGAARTYLQGCFSKEFSWTGFLGTVLFSILFFGVTCLVRKHRINKRT